METLECLVVLWREDTYILPFRGCIICYRKKNSVCGLKIHSLLTALETGNFKVSPFHIASESQIRAEAFLHKYPYSGHTLLRPKGSYVFLSLHKNNNCITWFYSHSNLNFTPNNLLSHTVSCIRRGNSRALKPQHIHHGRKEEFSPHMSK